MKGYELVRALEKESCEIATPERADLVYQAAQEIRTLIEDNKALLSVLDEVWAYPGLLRSIQGTILGDPLVKHIRTIVGG